MATLTYIPANISASQDHGSIVRNYEVAAGQTIEVGEAVYVTSDGEIALADANGSAAQSRAIGVLVASAEVMGRTTALAGERASVCVFGPVYGFYGMTPNAFAWVGPTAGDLVDTAPTGGVYQYIVGQSIEADVLFVNPGVAQPASV